MMPSDDVRRVHEAGLRILERTGMVFKHAKALAVFGAHGFEVDGQRVLMSAEQVLHALAPAPAEFVLQGRSPDRDLRFGGDGLVVATGAGPPLLVEAGASRPCTDDDLQTSIRLAHQLANVDMIGFPLEPQDVPPADRYTLCVRRALTLSDKPLEYALSTAEHLQVALDTSEILFGSRWEERPRLFGVVNTVSPLQLEADACLAVVELAARRQPLCVTPCAMGGTTGPVTLAGLVALQHAEILGGLVLAQLVSPGCPVVYGGFSSVASMVSGDPLFGVPEYWLAMTTTVQLARHLSLPSRAGAAVTDAHLPDLQAGIESAAAMTAVVEAGVNFVLHGAGILSALNAMSFEKLVADDEMVGMLRTLRAGVPVDDESLAVDVIGRVGPGGNFLLEEHTAAHCRDGYRPSFFNRRRHDAWRQHGGRDVVAEASLRAAALLASYGAPELEESTLRRLHEYAPGSGPA